MSATKSERELVEASQLLPEAIETYGLRVVYFLIQEIQHGLGSYSEVTM
jgi:hypothetical protein